MILGSENLPKCPGFDFALDEHLQMMVDDEAEILPGMCGQDEGIPPLNVTRMTSIFKQARPDEPCASSSHDTAPNKVKLLTERDRKRKITNNADFDDFPWSTTANFKSSWLTDINRYQKDVSKIADYM